MAHIHLIVGPVGAGKSTFALELARKHAAVRLNLDEWMAVLFRPDRPDNGVTAWYSERTARCLELMWTLTPQILEANANVVLEVGMLQRGEREQFYDRVKVWGYDLTVYVLDAPRHVRRKRVEQRNREQGETFSMVVPPHIFELASDVWEPPDEAERKGRDIRFVHDEQRK
jgi:predicted kinase